MSLTKKSVLRVGFFFMSLTMSWDCGKLAISHLVIMPIL